jgi:mono/diheme cytochrome c family protein
MKKRYIFLLLILAGLCVAEGSLLLYSHLKAGWQEAAGQTPTERGREIADRMGCFGCHGAGGTSPIANPGAAYGEVPGWDGGTWMMWNDSEEDVRLWITEGHPPNRPPDPEALIPMPAYGDLLSEAEVDDLVAYVLAVSQFGWDTPPLVTEGRELSVRLGCLGCHGPEGRGLIWNPGSFKGFVPAWDGEDYADLVRSDDEFREWIRNGVSDRLAANPAARHFLDSQPIKMPAYGDRVSDEQIDALLAYVNWVRATSRTGHGSPAP